MFGIIYGNDGAACSATDVPDPTNHGASIKADTLFPYSSVVNPGGDPTSGFLTCANNCPGNNYCDIVQQV